MRTVGYSGGTNLKHAHRNTTEMGRVEGTLGAVASPSHPTVLKELSVTLVCYPQLHLMFPLRTSAGNGCSFSGMSHRPRKGFVWYTTAFAFICGSFCLGWILTNETPAFTNLSLEQNLSLTKWMDKFNIPYDVRRDGRDIWMSRWYVLRMKQMDNTPTLMQ